MDLKARQEEMRLRHSRRKGPGRPPKQRDTAFADDITPKRVAGVYMLHRFGDYYIGQSANVTGRYAAHVVDIPHDSEWPHLILLEEINDTDQRLAAEKRYIAAARFLGLILDNCRISQYFSDQIEKEIARLRDVVKILANR